MSGPRFDPTINLGHIVMLAGLMGSVFLAYANVKASAAVDEQRITTLEKAVSENSAFQATILGALSDIKVDIGVLKAKDNFPK